MFFLSGFSAESSYFVTLGIAAFIAYKVYRQYGLDVGTLFLWASFCALRIFAAPTSPWANEDPAWSASLSLSAASTLLTVCLILWVAPYITDSFWKWVAFTNTVMLFFGQGLLGNYSMSGCFSACLIPFYPITGIIGAVASRQSQPMAITCAVLGIYLLRRRRFTGLASVTVSVIGIAAVICRHGLFDPNGRIAIWKDAYSFVADHVNAFIGAGLGSFYYIGPFLSVKKYGVGFVTLHSDWYQIFFEMGSIGFALSLIVFISALLRSYRRERLSTSLFAFGLFGIANFPLHNPISALLGAWLMYAAL